VNRNEVQQCLSRTHRSSQHTAEVQGCDPTVNIRGDSYRQRHRKNAGLPSLQGANADDQELRGANM
jgi:hypothetical protein